MSENTPDIIVATSMAIHGVHAPKEEAKVKLNTIAIKAPITIKPSSQMFTKPDLSLNTPPSAVKMSSAEKYNEHGIIAFKISTIYVSPFLIFNNAQRMI